MTLCNGCIPGLQLRCRRSMDATRSLPWQRPDEECLKGVTKVELETLLDTVQRLHKKLGRPPNSLLLKNLPARGASEKLLTVAAEIKCDVCLENQIRASKPAVSVHREDRWWCTLQTDGLYMRFGEGSVPRPDDGR